MRIRIVLLILAVFFGIAAVIGVMIYINNVKASIIKEEELISVVVASQDIPKEMKVSEMLDRKFVETKEIPRKYLVDGALESLDNFKEYIAKIEIKKGEQLTSEKLGKIEELHVAFGVPEGYVAVSIPYDEIRGVSGLINVGDKVNVIATFTPSEDELVLFNKDIVTEKLLDMQKNQSSTAQISNEPSTSWFPTERLMDENNYIIFPQTKILLWNVEVLYIGSKIVNTGIAKESGGAFSQSSSTNTKGQEIVKTVTLAVTPEQAEKLVFSEELGRVWLALVPVNGIEEEKTPGRTYLNILDNWLFILLNLGDKNEENTCCGYWER